MNIDQTLEQLAHLQYPKQVDVTDRVMEQISQRPYLQPVRHSSRQLWTRISAVAAAAVVVLPIQSKSMKARLINVSPSLTVNLLHIKYSVRSKV